MQVHWGKMAAKLSVWVATEILLSLVGLDHLADYGEFMAGESSMLLDRPMQTWVTIGATPNPDFSSMLAAPVEELWKDDRPREC